MGKRDGKRKERWGEGWRLTVQGKGLIKHGVGVVRKNIVYKCMFVSMYLCTCTCACVCKCT